MIRREAIYFSFALLLSSLIGAVPESFAQDQFLNGFEVSPGDIDEWSTFNGATLTDVFQSTCWEQGNYSGQLVVSGGSSGIGLDANPPEPTPYPSTRFVAVDACAGAGGILRLGIFDGTTWMYSTSQTAATVLNDDNPVDAVDVLYLDFWDPALTQTPFADPVSITIDYSGASSTFHLDNLRFTNSVLSTPTPCPWPMCSPTFTLSMSPTYTYSPTISTTFTQSDTLTYSVTQSSTFTHTPTPTFSPTHTPTPTEVWSVTYSPTYSSSFTVTPTFTITPAEARPPMVYPNPWRVGSAMGGVYIARLRKGDAIRMYTVAGVLVRSLGPEELANADGKNPIMSVIGDRGDNDWIWKWDGTNDVGNPVVTGLYIAVVSHEDGGRDTAKVAIIR